MKLIPQYPGYMIDKIGNCYSFFRSVREDNGRIIEKVVDYSVKPKLLSTQFKPEKDRSQIRPHVIIRVNGKRTKVLISRLVAMAFLQNPRKFPCVRHLNDISDDNRVENLQWGTNTVNVADRHRNQTNDLTIAKLQRELNRYINKFGRMHDE